MYVRLNCICSVYVIYLYPINVLIFSDKLYFVLEMLIFHMIEVTHWFFSVACHEYYNSYNEYKYLS